MDTATSPPIRESVAAANMKKKSSLTAITVFIIAAAAVLPPATLIARADTGPKPYITVNCANLPGEEAYIDLLIDDPPLEDGAGFRYGSMDSVFDPDVYDAQRLDILKNYSEDGWRPALVTGTNTPLWGELRCEVNPDGSARAGFQYFGVPARFKVIVVTQDGSVAVSNVIERKAFSCIVDFDYAERSASSADIEQPDDGFDYYEVAAGERNPATQTAKQFAFTLSSTFIIEGLLLLAFGFKLKQSWKPFVFVNLGTQVLLNLLLLAAYSLAGLEIVFFVFVYVLAEILIMAAESVLFVRLFRQHSKPRRALYAVTANAVSFIAGLFVLGHFVL